jgi:hypothetical protein
MAVMIESLINLTSHRLPLVAVFGVSNAVSLREQGHLRGEQSIRIIYVGVMLFI